MSTHCYDQFGWEREKRRIDGLISTEEERKISCLEKKRAAAACAENMSFFLEQCNSCSSLLTRAFENASRFDETTVNSYAELIKSESSQLISYIKQISNAEQRLLNIENMYYGKVQNHIDNIKKLTPISVICEEKRQEAIAGNYTYYDEDDNYIEVLGESSAEYDDSLKDENEGVTIVK